MCGQRSRREKLLLDKFILFDLNVLKINKYILLSSSGRTIVRVCDGFPLNKQIGWPLGGSFHF